MAHLSLTADFILGAADPKQFPDTTAPEIAMVGRSNVGKSSLINAILRHGKVARVSSTPGKTQEINFFLTELGLIVVDLPGYGYAAVSKERRTHFSELIAAYLSTRTQIRCVFVLVDARHDPMPHDMAMLETLEFLGRDFVVALTKCDKISPEQIKARDAQMRVLLAACNHLVDVVATSATSGEGRNALIGIMKRITSTPKVVAK